jgi:TetR/AcrR family transcriptional repressor of bet genes
MPKVGMEPLRRQAMIDATIIEIGAAGTLDVTVSQIARRAGMSSALAHHYFGSKDQIFLAAMRQILELYRHGVKARVGVARSPRERILAIINASFAADQFEREIVAAWLTFYVKALQSPDVKRLLQVYTRRLNSNLMVNLREIFDAATARQVAAGLAAMIDGFYIRQALQDTALSQPEVCALVTDYLNLWLERWGSRA